MNIVSFRHKRLEKYYTTGNPKGLPKECITKLQVALDAIEAADDIAAWLTLPRGRPHGLKGQRKGDYSIRITANYRLTFSYDTVRNAAENIDFEDYHKA